MPPRLDEDLRPFMGDEASRATEKQQKADKTVKLNKRLAVHRLP